MNVEERYQSRHNRYLRMVAAILRGGSAVDCKVSEVLKCEDLTHIQFNILRILQGAQPKPLSAGQVSERLMFSKSDVTRLLDRLENKGLLERKMCAYNRRKLEIRITEAGTVKVNEILPRIESALDGFFSATVTEEDRDVVIRVLEQIANPEHATNQANH